MVEQGQHPREHPQTGRPGNGTWERAAGIAVPVLVVNGGIDSDDHIGMAERLVRTVADGRTATVVGTAHYPNMERPELFNALLHDFLEQALDR